MKLCASCKGVVHPATGHAWSARTLICFACTVRFFRWMRDHTRPRNGSDFYGAATKYKDPQ